MMWIEFGTPMGGQNAHPQLPNHIRAMPQRNHLAVPV